MLVLKFVLKFIGILNKDASPRAIAFGIALGSIWGLTPFMSLHNLLILAIIIFFRVNGTSAFLGLGVFSAVSPLFDPLTTRIGEFLLGIPALKGFYTALYNMPVVPWTRFNNTLTLGSLVFALALFIPMYLILQVLVVQYREKVMASIKKWRIVAIIQGSKLYGLYTRFSS